MLTCRVCGGGFLREPLLQFEKMPKGAQYFPDAGALEMESGIDLTVCQCSGCGVVQLGNDPVPYYKEVIRAAAVSTVVKEFKAKQFGEFIEKYSLQGKKIIEIGCGRGEFLSLLSSLNVSATGIEYAEASVNQCKKNGLSVSKGYVDNASYVLNGGPFDAFLLLMFLEHMPDPNSALRGIGNNLSDGAVGLVEVPNFDMMLRNNLFSEFIGDHLFYFTADTLRTVLNVNGFDVLECNETRDEYVLSVVVRKRLRADVSNFVSHQKKIATEINTFIDCFPVQKVAVWGAGHQALAILALTETAGKIRYVVDSASFKQGKFTPASHLPIVAPGFLLTDPVDAVIVMAASYSDEVAGILRQMLQGKVKIAILRDSGLETVVQ